jgi:hypothetical protein
LSFRPRGEINIGIELERSFRLPALAGLLCFAADLDFIRAGGVIVATQHRFEQFIIKFIEWIAAPGPNAAVANLASSDFTTESGVR